MFVNILISIVIAVITGVALGYFVAWLARLIDFTLDYGHIFSKVRFNQAKASAKRQGMEREIELALEDCKNAPFGDRITKMNRLYWILAKDDNKFKAWVCIFCMATRLTVYACFIVTVCLITLMAISKPGSEYLGALVVYIALFNIIAPVWAFKTIQDYENNLL